MSWPAAAEMPYRVIDILRQPILKATQRIENDGGCDLSIIKDNDWLSFPRHHRNHVKRWSDFNYPVLRVALKDFLDQPVSDNLEDTLRAWPDTVVGVHGQVEPSAIDPDVLIALGNQLNIALIYGTHLLQDAEYDCIEPVLRLDIGHIERAKGLVSDREFLLQYDWTLHVSDCGQEEEQPVAIGVNKTSQEFPLSLLEQFGVSRRLDERIEVTLCQLGTVCWYKDTPYAFILVPEGAVLLLFNKILETIQDTEITDAKPRLEVRYSIVPWEHNENDNLQMPLLMSLWALCMLAWCDYDRAVWDGSTVRLNTWHEVPVTGKKVYTNFLVPQDNRGHPPGARILRRVETPIRTSPQGTGNPSSCMFEKRRPNNSESPLESLAAAGSSSSTTDAAFSSSFSEVASSVENREMVCLDGGKACFKSMVPGTMANGQVSNAPSMSPATTSESLMSDPVNTAEHIQQLEPELAAATRATIPPSSTASDNRIDPAPEEAAVAVNSTSLFDNGNRNFAESQPIVGMQPAQANKKRKRDGTLEMEKLSPANNAPESWTARLRPRIRKPNYRE